MAAKQLKEKVGQVLEKYQRDKSALIDILQDTQSEIGYLPREALEQVGQGLGVPLSRVYSVATFFKAFSLKPRGRHLINVCLGTACHVRGADKVLEQMEQELGIKTRGNYPRPEIYPGDSQLRGRLRPGPDGHHRGRLSRRNDTG